MIENGTERRFAEHYETGSELGRGAMARVYQCKHIRTGKTFAVKIIDKRKCQLLPNHKGFHREIECMENSKHSTIIQLFETFETISTLHLVLEFAPGGSLAEHLRDNGSLSESDAKPAIRRIASALAFLHDRNIVHRDIKPQNILLMHKQRLSDVKLADFGCSRVVTENASSMVGTREFVAPEMVTVEPLRYGCAVDAWAVGVLLYQLLFNALPFHAKGRDELNDNIRNARYTIPSYPPASEDAIDFIRNLLQPDPLNRLSMSNALQHPWLRVTIPRYQNFTKSAVKRNETIVKSARSTSSTSPTTSPTFSRLQLSPVPNVMRLPTTTTSPSRSRSRSPSPTPFTRTQTSPTPVITPSAHMRLPMSAATARSRSPSPIYTRRQTSPNPTLTLTMPSPLTAPASFVRLPMSAATTRSRSPSPVHTRIPTSPSETRRTSVATTTKATTGASHNTRRYSQPNSPTHHHYHIDTKRRVVGLSRKVQLPEDSDTSSASANTRANTYANTYANTHASTARANTSTSSTAHASGNTSRNSSTSPNRVARVSANPTSHIIPNSSSSNNNNNNNISVGGGDGSNNTIPSRVTVLPLAIPAPRCVVPPDVGDSDDSDNSNQGRNEKQKNDGERFGNHNHMSKFTLDDVVDSDDVDHQLVTGHGVIRNLMRTGAIGNFEKKQP